MRKVSDVNLLTYEERAVAEAIVMKAVQDSATEILQSLKTPGVDSVSGHVFASAGDKYHVHVEWMVKSDNSHESAIKEVIFYDSKDAVVAAGKLHRERKLEPNQFRLSEAGVIVDAKGDTFKAKWHRFKESMGL